MRTPESTPTDPDQLIRFGSVASVDLAAGRCTVTIDEDGASDGATTPPIRWIEPRAGATRTWSPRSVGEQVVLLFLAGEIGKAVALRGISSSANPPAGDSLTELVHFPDGAVLSYDPEGHALTIALPAGATLSVKADGGIDFQGDVNITGKLTASDDVIASGKSLKNHKHGSVQSGSSQTGTPV